MSTTLLQTKFYIPDAHAALIPRPHLIEQLNEGLHSRRSLTLISGPAGYGKTTLIVAWLQQLRQESDARRAEHRQSRFAWLPLDEADSEPLRLFTYLLASIFLARLKQAQGDPAAALEARRQADLILNGFGVQRLAWISAAERARLALAQGNLASAQRWAEETMARRQTLSAAY